MIFKGIAPSLRNVDPDFLLFDINIRIHYIFARLSVVSTMMADAIRNFGISMKQAAEGMARIARVMNKEKTKWPNQSFRLNKD